MGHRSCYCENCYALRLQYFYNMVSTTLHTTLKVCKSNLGACYYSMRRQLCLHTHAYAHASKTCTHPVAQHMVYTDASLMPLNVK